MRDGARAAVFCVLFATACGRFHFAERGGTDDAGVPLTGRVLVMGAGGMQVTQSVAIDPFGSIYTSGYFNTSVGLDPEGGKTVEAFTGIWLSKVDATGTYVYSATWEGQGQIPTIVLDADDNLYLVGVFTGQIDLDPGAGLDPSVDTAGRYGGFLVKLDRDGNYAWGRSWRASEDFPIFDVDVAADGSVYAIGYEVGTADLDPGPGVVSHTGTGAPTAADAVLFHFDRDGTLLWARPFGDGATTYGFDLAIAPDGTVVCSGAFSGTVDLDPGTAVDAYTAPGVGGIFMVAYDPAGNYRWGWGVGGDMSDVIHDLVIGDDGSIYGVGRFSSPTVDFDPGAGDATVVALGQFDAFVAKYTASGSFAWVEPIATADNDNGWSIRRAGDDLIVAGDFHGAIDLDPGGGTAMHVAPSAMSATWLIRIDANGGLRWASSWGGTGNTMPGALAVGSYLYVGGQFEGTADFDPGPADAPHAARNQDTFVNLVVPDTGTWGVTN